MAFNPNHQQPAPYSLFARYVVFVPNDRFLYRLWCQAWKYRPPHHDELLLPAYGFHSLGVIGNSSQALAIPAEAHLDLSLAHMHRNRLQAIMLPMLDSFRYLRLQYGSSTIQLEAIL